jgi:L-asparaginase
MKKLILIQTGGTISMTMKKDKAELDLHYWHQVLKEEFPELSTLAEIETVPLFFEDSSDLNPEHWKRLAAVIEEKHEEVDGFVVLHGTDTMAYTSTALSFGLRGLKKPVIFTGSQVPMSNLRSDARRNLVNSIEIATCDIPEVCICFNDHVYRANRSTKMSIGDFDAFASPNTPPLAEIGLKIEISDQVLRDAQPFVNTCSYKNRIFVITLFPGMSMDYLDCLKLSELDALIIRTFGSGNFPTKGPFSLLPFLEKCREANVIVSIVSQADYDAVDLKTYSAGRKALELGAVGAKDMTLEAAVTKMMWLTEHYSDKDEIKELYKRPLAGELSR